MPKRSLRPCRAPGVAATTRLVVAAALLGALCLLARPALAEDEARGSDGTHFLAEAGVGTTVALGAEPDGVGLAAGAALGFGGKLPGTLLRLYVLASYRHAALSILREGASLDRSFDELALGGRALVPLFTPYLRVFADAMLGVGWLRDETALKGEVEVERVDPTARASAIVGFGAQFRPVLWISVGARADLSLLLDRAELPDDDVIGRIDLLGSVTLHF